MSDLISRSALMKYLRDYKWEFAMGSDFSKAMEMIEAQPTAYDVDAVVADIEDFREEAEQFGFASALSDIVEVVRNGGVHE